ncbi:hypothetical protein LshimejAT787_1105500 [Lyophyllum shimeji]|uniref:DUF6699 domain-containing protein n=1 Tax=Lyophyllum shimeji TaxID=47721 RepID=A0A9P3USJ0_LYOSH|nr:hypothetical protein LshimejAT787_1105500 [Lyophyllum shimeji]
MQYSYPATPKTYSSGGVDPRIQSPASNVSYSSWGTVSAPPTTVRSPAPLNGSPAPRPNGPPSLHPLLQPPGHLLQYDIRTRPQPINDLAFYPALTKTCISVKALREFTFNVENLSGITVQDILNMLYARLQHPMTRDDLGRLAPGESASAQKSFHSRTALDPSEYPKGMKCLDRLSGKFHFMGLVPSADVPGVWEIQLA